MWNWTSAAFVFLGVLHVPPAIGALSPDALSAAYGVEADEDLIRVLLQHRGAMFALVAVACLTAAWRPRWQPASAILAGWSMVSFLGIFLGAGTLSGPLLKIAIADGLGVAVLLPVAIVLRRGSTAPPADATR